MLEKTKVFFKHPATHVFWTVIASIIIGQIITWNSFYCLHFDTDHMEESTVLLDQDTAPYTKFLWLAYDGMGSDKFNKHFLDIFQGKEEGMPDESEGMDARFWLMDRPKVSQFSASLWAMMTSGQKHMTEGVIKGVDTLFKVFPGDTELTVESNEFPLIDTYFGDKAFDNVYTIEMAANRWAKFAKYNEILHEGLSRAMNRTKYENVSSFVYDMRLDSLGHSLNAEDGLEYFDYDIVQMKEVARKVFKWAKENPDTLIIVASDHGTYQDKGGIQHKPGIRTTNSIEESTVHGKAYIDNAATFAVIGSTENRPFPVPPRSSFSMNHWDATRQYYNPDYTGDYNISKVSGFDFTMRHLDVPITLALFLKDFPIIRSSVGIPMGPNVLLENISDGDAVKICTNLHDRFLKIKHDRPDNVIADAELTLMPIAEACSIADARANAIEMSFEIDENWCSRSIWGTVWVFELVMGLLFTSYMGKRSSDISRCTHFQF
jgi:hypothetical protein